MQRQGVGGGHHQHPFHVGALGSLLAAVVDHVQADEQVGVHLGDVIVIRQLGQDIHTQHFQRMRGEVQLFKNVFQGQYFVLFYVEEVQ